MKQIISLGLLVLLCMAVPLAEAGTKEELMRLQKDVLALQNQFLELQKTFNEKSDGLKSLVEQLNDQAAKSNMLIEKVLKILESQATGTRSADQALLKEIRTLSGKVDESSTRISALAQQINELKVQSQSLNQETNSGTSLSPEVLFKQAENDLIEGRVDLSIKGFNTFIENYPGGEQAAAAHYYLGEAYRSQNKLQQAISAYTQVINEYPDSNRVAVALLKRAKAELTMQEKENAIADFKNIIEKYPTTQEAQQAKDALLELGVGAAKPAKAKPRKTR
jgi:tol-pal system protein YbgF